ncbi:hypothetical protein PT974_02992 [Cladobotryum mycophilum]|uniref:Heterokaryon incompatibility domain-containing protein n=1 Tax=Cladobotryum mycophilum TaxID=491253 RepID=A0ABR0SZL2_9HYPO
MGNSFSTSRRHCGLCYFELDQDSVALREPTVFRSFNWLSTKLSRPNMEGRHGPLDEQIPAHFRDPDVLRYQVDIRTHLRALQASQARGCRSCDAIMRLIESACEDDGVFLDNQSWKEEVYLRWNSLSNSRGTGNLRIKFTVDVGDRKVESNRFGRHQRWTLFVDVDQIDGKKIKRDYHPFPRQLAVPRGDTGSEKSMGQIRTWLRDCDSSHTSCMYTPNTPLPKRVLEVTLDAQGNTATRLVQDLDLREKYACLSHRWGPSTLLCRTTKETLEAHLLSVPWSKLPKSFQDAATVTYQLGIKYIWIDSLCIVQDDTADWLDQAAQMCDIYSNAYVTLAAAWSDDSATGLFRTSTAYTIKPPAHLGRGAPSYLIQRVPDHMTWEPEGVLKMTPELPLLSRAWVYQERLLSPRMAYFTRYEVAFECGSGSEESCECGHVAGGSWGGGHGNAVGLLGQFTNSRKRDHSTILRTTKLSEIKRYWHQMIREYSALRITFESDRLPAIAGVARQYGNLHSAHLGRYVAGMWESLFPSELLWYCPDNVELLQRYNCGPTWSWITVRGEAAHMTTIGRTYPDDLRVINIDFKLQGPDPYAAISDAVLEVQGYLVPGTLLKNDHVFFNRTNPLFKAPSGDAFSFHPDYAFHDPGPDMLELGGQIFCMKTGFVWGGNHVCLLLNQVEEWSKTFKRIGLVEAVSKTDMDLLFTEDIEKQVIRLV